MKTGMQGRGVLVTPKLFGLTMALLTTVGFLCVRLGTSSAATLYVDSNSASSEPPFASWATAARTIQDAIDAAEPADLVLVTNGVYDTGGRVVYGLMTNRVALTKAVTVASLNGPTDTLIMGNRGYAGGPTAIRCAYLTNGALLTGFTLTNSATVTSGDFTREMSGGAVWCESTNATVRNCVVAGNWAAHYGGGAHGGTLINCLIRSNMASQG